MNQILLIYIIVSYYIKLGSNIMFKKVVFILILGLITIGVVVAAENTTFSFDVPSDFKDLGDGVYVLHDTLGKPNQVLSIVEYSEHDEEDYLTNDSGNKYTVYAGDNNTFNFVDGSMDEKGTFEIIEINGTKFIVDFVKEGIGNEKDFSETFNSLMQFNKLNNVTGIEIVITNSTDQ